MTRKNLNFKILFILKIIIIYLVVTLKSYADTTKINKNIIAIGSYDAIVKIKIFSSLTCPHCANFHINVIPKLKKEYVDTGTAQLIFIDFPLDQAAFNASKLLHCIDKKKQINFLDIIYGNQSKWTNGSSIENINNNLKKIVKNLGISSTHFDKCLNNDVIGDNILIGRIDGQQKYSINATPTIIINEKKHEGTTTFKSIQKKIEELI